MEGLLLVSLRILRAVNSNVRNRDQLGQRLLVLNEQRDALLSTLPADTTKTPADRARWELVRYLNKVAQKKISAKI